MLVSHPEAVAATNTRGFNPLHLASCFSTLEVMQELLHVSAQPLWMKNVWRRTPREHMRYHMSFSNHNEGEIFEAFWEKYCLLVQVEYFHKELKGSATLGNGHPIVIGTSDRSRHALKGCSQQRTTTVRIDSVGQLMTSGGALVLHAFISTECNDPKIIGLATERYRENLCCPDGNGNYPLHLACASNGGQLCSLQKILDAYPEAASIANYAGELPLHIAVKHGREWHEGVESLIWAHSAALTAKDSTTGMLPFALACLSRPRVQSITTFYELLRPCPELSRFGLVMNV
jgi:hypothetical protein